MGAIPALLRRARESCPSRFRPRSSWLLSGRKRDRERRLWLHLARPRRVIPVLGGSALRGHDAQAGSSVGRAAALQAAGRRFEPCPAYKSSSRRRSREAFHRPWSTTRRRWRTSDRPRGAVARREGSPPGALLYSRGPHGAVGVAIPDGSTGEETSHPTSRSREARRIRKMSRPRAGASTCAVAEMFQHECAFVSPRARGDVLLRWDVTFRLDSVGSPSVPWVDRV